MKKTSRMLFRVVPFAVSLVAGAAAGASEVTVGAVGPLTGPAATSGLTWEKTFRYVLDQASKSGEIVIDGTPATIKLIVEDSQSKPDIGLSAAQKLLTRDNVDILTGDLIHSDVTLAVMELASSFPKFMYTGGGTSVGIGDKIAADPDRYRYVWKHQLSSLAHARSAAGTIEMLAADGKVPVREKVIGVIAEDSGYSTPILAELERILGEAGWKLQVEKVAMTQADFYPVLSKLLPQNPEFIVSIFTGTNSAIALTKQLKEQGSKSVHVGINGPNLPGYLDAVGAAADGTVFLPMLFDPVNDTEHAKVAAELTAALGDTEIGNLHVDAYCHGKVFVDILKRAGSVAPDKLAEAAANTSYVCLTGRWVFDADTHSPKLGPGFLPDPSGQIMGGKRSIIWPKEVATGEFQTAE
ncbi:MAG TPA: ABC transporter substrate-binding protein [Bauldia sp.]|nr:ABC transporter substrate-binding protein [Bauldia sp.]